MNAFSARHYNIYLHLITPYIVQRNCLKVVIADIFFLLCHSFV